MLNPYILCIALIVLVLLVVSFARLHTVRTKADFLVAGRSLPAYVFVFTLLSSWIGAGSLFAGAENAFRNGYAALWQPGGGWVALIVIYFVAPRARKFAQYTIPDLLETRYNQTARLLGMIAILFAYTAITSYQLRGGGDILHLAFGIDRNSGMYIIAAFVILFTAVAGMSSIAYVDVAIGILIIVTSFLSVPILLHRAGGWSGVHAALPPTHFEVLGNISLARAFEFFLPTGLLMLGNQSMYQKFFSAKTERDATRAVVGWIVGTVVLETLIVTLAILGSALYGPHSEVAAHPREIIPFTARNALPASIGALLMGAVFAKVISTANNYLFSPATNVVNDIYVRYVRPAASNRRVLVVSRVVVVLLGGWALLQGVRLESVLEKALYAYTIYSAAITPVVMAAFFWKRATAAGAVSSIAAGTVVTVLWDTVWFKGHLPPAWAARDAIFPALLAALVCLFAVSLATPAPAPEKWAPFFPDTEPAEASRAQV